MKKEHAVAEYLISSYENITNTPFANNELLLQKLMYFAQKTSFALTGQPLFEEQFEGWIHGPVLKSLRYYFEYITPNANKTELTDTEKYVVDNTIFNYGQYAPWRLRDLSHDETAWQKSRIGLTDLEHGSIGIKMEDILKDASKVRLYDHQYDMFIDEFEDVDEKEFVHIG